jgi:integrase
MDKGIRDVIDGVLDAYVERGLKKTTIQMYTEGYFRPAERFLNAQANGRFDPTALRAFRDTYYRRFNEGKINRKHYSAARHAVRHLIEFGETGTLDFSPDCQRKQYIPEQESQEVIDAALGALKTGDNERNRLNSYLRKFFCYLANNRISICQISTSVFSDYLRSIHDVSSGETYRAVRSLKALADYLEGIGVVNAGTRRSLDAYKAPSVGTRLIESYTEDEVRRIVGCIDIGSPAGRRNKAIVLLAVSTGLRGGDIVKLQLNSIDWERGTLTIIQGKTGQPLETPVNGQTLNAIADYLLTSRPKSDSTLLFTSCFPPHEGLVGVSSLNYMLTVACERAGVEKKYRRLFHSLRRSFGTWAVREQVPYELVSQMLGHRLTDSSKPYISFADAQIRQCAMGFEDVSISGGVYA